MKLNSIPQFQPNPSTLQEVSHPTAEKAGVQLLLKRDDLIDPYLSGNKWRKLKYNLLQARAENHDTLLTFGGAYSNHIFSVAAAGKKFGFKTIGIIRGEEHLPLNPTLQFAVDSGMYLHYMDRSTYRKKNSEVVIGQLEGQFGSFYLIPEGGTNELAVKGTSEIMKELSEVGFDYICCACGTGGTLAGIVSGLKGNQKAMGFSALKGGDFLVKDVQQWLPEDASENWQIETGFHFGGYAKKKPELLEFMETFRQQTGIPLDPIYTGKMMFGVIQKIKSNYFPCGSKLVVIHTGGLQLNHPGLIYDWQINAPNA